MPRSDCDSDSESQSGTVLGGRRPKAEDVAPRTSHKPGSQRRGRQARPRSSSCLLCSTTDGEIDTVVRGADFCHRCGLEVRSFYRGMGSCPKMKAHYDRQLNTNPDAWRAKVSAYAEDRSLGLLDVRSEMED